jgi:hypothetical protein
MAYPTFEYQSMPRMVYGSGEYRSGVREVRAVREGGQGDEISERYHQQKN